MLKNLKKMISALFLLIFVAGASCAAPMGRLVLLRHGESVWNKEDRFTGWSDVALTEKGEKDAFHAGELMKEAGLNFDAVHVSMLSRAVKTAWNSMEGMNALWLPVSSYWRLNERCYGDLEGKTRKEVADAVGADQVKIWRRSFATPPPALSYDDPRSPAKDPRYAKLDRRVIPQAESLKDTIARVGPYWSDVLVPALRSGQNVLVVGHSTCLRALSAWIEPNLDEKALQKLEIPNAAPIVYELGDDLSVLSRRMLGVEKK